MLTQECKLSSIDTDNVFVHACVCVCACFEIKNNICVLSFVNFVQCQFLNIVKRKHYNCIFKKTWKSRLFRKSVVKYCWIHLTHVKMKSSSIEPMSLWLFLFTMLLPIKRRTCRTHLHQCVWTNAIFEDEWKMSSVKHWQRFGFCFSVFRFVCNSNNNLLHTTCNRKRKQNQTWQWTKKNERQKSNCVIEIVLLNGSCTWQIACRNYFFRLSHWMLRRESCLFVFNIFMKMTTCKLFICFHTKYLRVSSGHHKRHGMYQGAVCENVNKWFRTKVKRHFF